MASATRQSLVHRRLASIAGNPEAAVGQGGQSAWNQAGIGHLQMDGAALAKILVSIFASHSCNMVNANAILDDVS
jgi:hypothetical protein